MNNTFLLKYLLKTVLLGLGLTFFALSSIAQVENKLVKEDSTKTSNDNLNKTDKKGKKQGMWFYDHPSRFGDPAYYEFGSYNNDLKSGLWYKLSKERQLIAVENFKNNELDGPAQYYEDGKLSVLGNYRGIFTPYAFDSFMVQDPLTFQDSLVVVPAEKGFTKHGNWRYYDPNSGHLVVEREYQVDIIIKESKFHLPTPKPEVGAEPPKMPHQGGKEKGWNIQKSKDRNSLIK